VIACPECGGRTAPSKLAGFVACGSCGKLIVAPKGNDAELAAEQDPDAPVAIKPRVGDLVIPDYSEVMKGWRSWQISSDSFAEPLLRSVVIDTAWQPREPVEATCDYVTGKPEHSSPGESCSCGLYAAKTREHLQSMGYHRYDPENGTYSVIGIVQLWGTIVEGTQGWRAQFGYPERLFVPWEAWHLAKPLREAYGVPVELNNVLASEQKGK
jgi:hypothetical protein